MSTLVVLLTIGLIARITRVLTVDRITYPIRARIVVRPGPDHPIAYFVTCPWCIGLWVSPAGVSAAAPTSGRTPDGGCTRRSPGTASLTTGLLIQYTTGDEDA